MMCDILNASYQAKLYTIIYAGNKQIFPQHSLYVDIAFLFA